MLDMDQAGKGRSLDALLYLVLSETATPIHDDLGYLRQGPSS